ncbi:MAG: cytochrome P460 family protein [Steroidobacteraceae bacterium]
MVNKVAIASIVALLALAGTATSETSLVPDAKEDAPRYTPTGDLQVPEHYREWVFLSSGLNMSYRPVAAAEGHSTFDNVFVNPAAYRAFLQSGTWPDKTLFMLEVRAAAGATSINKNGQTQSQQILAKELHVKDARLDGGWGFFTLEESGPGKPIKRPAPCYTCHEAHAAVDTTFVQFYPTLLPVAKAKGTLSPAYLKDEQAGTTVK